MRILNVLGAIATAVTVVSAQCPNVTGISDLVKRRLSNHVNDFTFVLTNTSTPRNSSAYDAYTVSTPTNGTVVVQGNTLSALSTG